MLLEKNGRASSSKRTRHINIRYFFVTDRINAKEISVEYCPTGEMIADFFTKPLQGSLFKKFRDQIMNVASTADSMQNHRSVLGNMDAGAGDGTDGTCSEGAGDGTDGTCSEGAGDGTDGTCSEGAGDGADGTCSEGAGDGTWTVVQRKRGKGNVPGGGAKG
jgi:hypothetical protein